MKQRGINDGRQEAVEPVRRFMGERHIITLLPRGSYEARHVPASGLIGYAFDSQRGTHAFASDRRTPFTRFPNTVSWVPPGCDVWSRSDVGGEYLTVALRAGDRGDLLPDRPYNAYRHALARQAASTLRTALIHGVDDVDSYLPGIEQLENAVLQSCDAAAGQQRSAARWLTPRRLQCLNDYIDAHLDKRPGVSDLACVCDVSAGFLSRVLPAATGCTPHRYVLDRRLMHARRMISGGQNTLLQIALDCGFASHSHLSSSLRRYVGVTPTAIRQFSAVTTANVDVRL